MDRCEVVSKDRRGGIAIEDRRNEIGRVEASCDRSKDFRHVPVERGNADKVSGEEPGESWKGASREEGEGAAIDSVKKSRGTPGWSHVLNESSSHR
jgi:hypothetical protein